MGPRPAFHALQRSAARHGHGGENRDIWRAGAASWAQRAGPLHNHLAGHKLWRDQAIAHAASVQGRQRRNKPTERVFVLRGHGVARACRHESRVSRTIPCALAGQLCSRLSCNHLSLYNQCTFEVFISSLAGACCSKVYRGIKGMKLPSAFLTVSQRNFVARVARQLVDKT